MVPDPRTPVCGLRLRPRNSILRHSWALNGSGNLKLRAKVKTAWQVRDGKVKGAWQVRGGKGGGQGAQPPSLDLSGGQGPQAPVP